MSYIEEQVKTRIGIRNFLPERGAGEAVNEIMEGLYASRKYISPKYFYDRTGSELFEQITRLKEYYPTRCEKEIISGLADELDDVDFTGLEVFELGCGDAGKISTFFDQISFGALTTMSYVPVDISSSAVKNTVEAVNRDFPLKKIDGYVMDFNHQMNLIPRAGRRLYCFFGGTIGNFDQEDVETFIRSLGEVMEDEDALLMGVDMVKDISVIESAYNDRRGITAQFNKNILNVINELTGSNFDTRDFEHLALYNYKMNRIEMHLKAKRALEIDFGPGNKPVKFKRGETIHTENSHKFTGDQLEKIGRTGGMQIHRVLSDSNGWFSLAFFTR